MYRLFGQIISLLLYHGIWLTAPASAAVIKMHAKSEKRGKPPSTLEIKPDRNNQKT